MIQPEQVDTQLPAQKVREFLSNEKKQRAMLAKLLEMREGKEMELSEKRILKKRVDEAVSAS